MTSQNSKVPDKTLIVGLGNPGKEYENTRHNAGFMAVEAIAAAHEFPAFTLSKKHNALVSVGKIGGKKTILAKPQTYMNDSGAAVRSLLNFYNLAPERLLAVHDDIDIPIGELKIAKARGSAGHKGVESIIGALGTKEFTRARVGILPAAGKPSDVDEFVLRRFTSREQNALLPVLKQIEILAAEPR